MFETTETQHAFETFEACWLKVLASARIEARNAADIRAMVKKASFNVMCLEYQGRGGFEVEASSKVFVIGDKMGATLSL